MERRRGAGRATAFVLAGITTLVLFEAVRVLFPLLYDLREDDGVATAVAVAIGVFAGAPALTGVVRRLFGSTVSFVLCFLGLAGGRLAM